MAAVSALGRTVCVLICRSIPCASVRWYWLFLSISIGFREAREGEEFISRFFQAIGDGVTFEPPFADEDLSLRLNLLLRLGVNHVVVVSRDFLVQPIWRVAEKVAALVHGAALTGTSDQSAASALSRPERHRQ